MPPTARLGSRYGTAAPPINLPPTETLSRGASPLGTSFVRSGISGAIGQGLPPNDSFARSGAANLPPTGAIGCGSGQLPSGPPIGSSIRMLPTGSRGASPPPVHTIGSGYFGSLSQAVPAQASVCGASFAASVQDSFIPAPRNQMPPTASGPLRSCGVSPPPIGTIGSGQFGSLASVQDSFIPAPHNQPAAASGLLENSIRVPPTGSPGIGASSPPVGTIGSGQFGSFASVKDSFIPASRRPKIFAAATVVDRDAAELLPPRSSGHMPSASSSLGSVGSFVPSPMRARRSGSIPFHSGGSIDSFVPAPSTRSPHESGCFGQHAARPPPFDTIGSARGSGRFDSPTKNGGVGGGGDAIGLSFVSSSVGSRLPSSARRSACGSDQQSDFTMPCASASHASQPPIGASTPPEGLDEEPSQCEELVRTAPPRKGRGDGALVAATSRAGLPMRRVESSSVRAWRGQTPPRPLGNARTRVEPTPPEREPPENRGLRVTIVAIRGLPEEDRRARPRCVCKVLRRDGALSLCRLQTPLMPSVWDTLWNYGEELQGYSPNDDLELSIVADVPFGSDFASDGVIGTALLRCDQFFPFGFDGELTISCPGKGIRGLLQVCIAPASAEGPDTCNVASSQARSRVAPWPGHAGYNARLCSARGTFGYSSSRHASPLSLALLGGREGRRIPSPPCRLGAPSALGLLSCRRVVGDLGWPRLGAGWSEDASVLASPDPVGAGFADWRMSRLVAVR